MDVSLAQILLLFLVVVSAAGKFQVSEQDIRVLLNSRKNFYLYTIEKNITEDIEIYFESQYVDIVRTEPAHFIARKDEFNWTIEVLGLKPGYAVISTNITSIDLSDYSEAFVRVTVERSVILYHVSAIVGWIYFLAWSISFYPQIYSNYKRKSVVGLNFDFLSLNFVGFLMYSLFNCGLYWIPEIEQEYFSRYPKGLNPVQVNDIFFALHAIFATLLTIFQCFIYETGTQRISTTARIIHGIISSCVIVFAVLALLTVIQWLDFLYYCSYIKLAITLIKYIPQAFYNYKRQSTVGWSIGNIFLDFTGGILSMLQMILNAYNYDDWESIFGDPTKFGLGFFSVAFDIFFLVQHYILYRNTHEKVIDLKGRV